MVKTRGSGLSSVSVVTLSLLGGCATETQSETLAGLLPDAGGNSGSGGSEDIPSAGTDSGGTSAGTSIFGGGGMATTAGTFGGPGGSGGVAGSGGSAGGAAGSGGAGGSGGKASGGSGGGGSGGMPVETCGKVELSIKAATALSVENDTFPASNAFDGDAMSRWASAQGVDPQWIYFDLGEVAHVSRVVITWEAAYATAYEIEVADNANGPWTSLFQEKAGNGATDDVTLTAGKGRYVRMFGTARALQYGYSIYEFEIYGDLDEQCR